MHCLWYMQANITSLIPCQLYTLCCFFYKYTRHNVQMYKIDLLNIDFHQKSKDFSKKPHFMFFILSMAVHCLGTGLSATKSTVTMRLYCHSYCPSCIIFRPFILIWYTIWSPVAPYYVVRCTCSEFRVPQGIHPPAEIYRFANAAYLHSLVRL